MGKVVEGERITVRDGTYDDSPWRTGVVTDLLSTQFTITSEVERADGGWEERVYYAFYASEGSDWRRGES